MSHSPVNPTTLHISSTVSTYTFYFCSAPQTSINSLFLLNVLVCSFPCPYQLLSHFITEKGVFLASPLINCAAPPLGRNESYPSFFTLHDNTLGNMLIYLFIPGLSTWVFFFHFFFFCWLVCQQPFSALFLLMFYINISKIYKNLWNLSIISHGFHIQKTVIIK